MMCLEICLGETPEGLNIQVYTQEDADDSCSDYEGRKMGGGGGRRGTVAYEINKAIFRRSTT